VGIPVTFTWTAASATSVAALQTFGAAGSLSLNGSLSQLLRPDSPDTFVSLGGIFRTITLTSTNNLSGVNFSITGTDAYGNTVTEIIAGPTSNTVATTGFFGTVTSITFDAAVTAVSAGTGQTGTTGWFTYDMHCNNANLGIAVSVTGTITYSTQVTLDYVNGTSSPVLFTPITAMTTATTNQITNLILPIRFARVAITASTGGATLKAVFIQQGLES
jgi:hypothetical protein